MDRQEERNVENTMSGNDLQNRCGLNDTQELRSPPEVDCQQPESPQGGPRHLGEACAPRTGTSARGSGHRPAVACATAPRRHASRLRSGFGSRLRAALLSVLALVLGLPFAGPAAAQEVVEVPRAWTLKPSGLSATQKEFRLLFVTSTGRNAQSSNIGTTTATCRAAPPPGIPRSGPSPRSSGSWPAQRRDARNNTGTTTHLRTRVPIWWVNGSKVADNYQDFYDGSWDSESGRNEAGNSQGTGSCFTVSSNGRAVWTGSNNNGTGAATLAQLGIGSVRVGALSCSRTNPLGRKTRQ